MSKENSFIADVRDFHARCGYVHCKVPSVDDEEMCKLWTSLIAEEADELLHAISEGDVIGVADGLGDLLYVCIGAGLGFGIPIEEVFDEVHRSNLSKLASSVRARGDGKILRGSSYKEPRISDLLKLRGWKEK